METGVSLLHIKVVLMSKIKQREAMKTLALINHTCDVAGKIIKFSQLPFGYLAIETLKATALATSKAISSSPAKHFRIDKPELDKRRVKRFNNSNPYKVLKCTGRIISASDINKIWVDLGRGPAATVYTQGKWPCSVGVITVVGDETLEKLKALKGSEPYKCEVSTGYRIDTNLIGGDQDA